jgi:hypothetical protein
MLEVQLKRGGACLAVVIASQLAGCESLRLYSDKRNQQGIDAKTAWSKVDFKAMIAADRDNLNKILQAQLDLQDKYATAVRDHHLREILASKQDVKGALGSLIDGELAVLLGQGDIDKAVAGYLEQSSSAGQTRIAQAKYLFSQAGMTAPSCADFAWKRSGARSFELVKPEELRQAYDKLAASKNPLDRRKLASLNSGLVALMQGCASASGNMPYAAFDGLTGAALQQAMKTAEADNKKLEDVRTQGKRLESSYKQAKDAYEKVAGRPGQAPAATPVQLPAAAASSGAQICNPVDAAGLKESQKEVAEAGHKLCEAVLAIEKADSALGKKFLSEQRLASIQALVDTVNQTRPGDPVPEGAGKATAAYVLIPGLLDEANAAIAAKKKPVAMSFLIKRNIEQLKLEAANREIALLQARADLSRLVVEGIINEAVLLWKARSNLAANPVLGARPMATVFDNASADEKVTLYSALANYVDAVSRQEVKWRKAEVKRLSTYHEMTLAYAEVNLKQWSSLIDTSVQQVGDSAAGGIKSESITNLLNTIGIFYIGHGVNK